MPPRQVSGCVLIGIAVKVLVIARQITTGVLHQLIRTTPSKFDGLNRDFSAEC